MAPAARFDAVGRAVRSDIADCAQALQLADDEFSFFVGVGVGRVRDLEGGRPSVRFTRPQPPESSLGIPRRYQSTPELLWAYRSLSAQRRARCVGMGRQLAGQGDRQADCTGARV
jgi:hypothetical protein